jgi:hypothetical protein
MAAPAWLSDVFAAVMLAVASYCAGRLTVAWAWRRETDLDADGVHVFMGVAMAGMLAPALSVLTPAAWEAVFALWAVWFAWQAARAWRGDGAGAWRCAFPVPHLVESLAMVYAFTAVRSTAGGTGAGMTGMGGAAGAVRFPVLAVVFALFMVGYVAWLGDRLSSIGPGVVVAPRTAACYKIAMGITMGYMLIIVL